MKPLVYYFCLAYPPQARSRMEQLFAHVLAEHAYAVRVITIANPHGFFSTYPYDDTLPSDPPNVQVERVRVLNWWALGELLAQVGLLSDPHLNWYWAVQRQWSNISQAGPGILLGTTPFINCRLALWAKEQTGWPFVLDYRDEVLDVAAPQPGRQRQQLLALEQKLVTAANLISVTSHTVKERLQERYNLAEDRLVVVLNGYNESAEVSAPTGPSKAGDILRVVYAGGFTQMQWPTLICQAYQQLMTRRSDLQGRIQVTFYGPENYYVRYVLRRYLGEGLIYGGLIPYNQLNQKILEHDVGFVSLVDDRFDYCLPRKLFDYINLERPILGALPQGEAQKIIKENDLGLVADFADAETLARHLEQLADEPQLRHYYREQVRAIKDGYSLPVQIAKLAKRMTSLIQKIEV